MSNFICMNRITKTRWYQSKRNSRTDPFIFLSIFVFLFVCLFVRLCIHYDDTHSSVSFLSFIFRMLYAPFDRCQTPDRTHHARLGSHCATNCAVRPTSTTTMHQSRSQYQQLPFQRHSLGTRKVHRTRSSGTDHHVWDDQMIEVHI